MDDGAAIRHHLTLALMDAHKAALFAHRSKDPVGQSYGSGLRTAVRDIAKAMNIELRIPTDAEVDAWAREMGPERPPLTWPEG